MWELFRSLAFTCILPKTRDDDDLLIRFSLSRSRISFLIVAEGSHRARERIERMFLIISSSRAFSVSFGCFGNHELELFFVFFFLLSIPVVLNKNNYSFYVNAKYWSR